MRSLNVIIEKQVGNACLGRLEDTNKTIASVKLNQLIPYISGHEDIDVIAHHSNLLEVNQMLEINGFQTKSILKIARYTQGTVDDSFVPFTKLVSSHPLIMSFPSEVVWLTPSNGIDNFLDNICWILQNNNFNFEKEKAKKIRDYYKQLLYSSAKKYQFWASINERIDSERLSNLLINIQIELALQSRAKFLAGLTPIINIQTSGSVELSHNWNLAFANIIEQRLDQGLGAPKCLYNIALNSSMILNDDCEELKRVVKFTREGMKNNLFDGICISVRNLQHISGLSGKVNTLSKFINDINTISREEKLPVFYSRFGLIGLNAFDNGANFASYCLNMNISDIFPTGFRRDKTTDKNDTFGYGKILNHETRELLDKSQVIKLEKGMPLLNNVPNKPIPSQLESATDYRKNFVKPYNMAAMGKLNQDWINNTDNGEIRPGMEYLKIFRSPNFYNSWGDSN
jgi:hypothetical protein